MTDFTGRFVLPPEEGLMLFERCAQELIGIPGLLVLWNYENGFYDELPDNEFRRKIERVLYYLPFVREAFKDTP